jgi:hypothetical protein
LVSQKAAKNENTKEKKEEKKIKKVEKRPEARSRWQLTDHTGRGMIGCRRTH